MFFSPLNLHSELANAGDERAIDSASEHCDGVFFLFDTSLGIYAGVVRCINHSFVAHQPASASRLHWMENTGL
jgi:hypothetical protein